MAESDWWLNVGSHCSGEPSFAIGVAAIRPSVVRTERIEETQSFIALLSPAELRAVQGAVDAKIAITTLTRDQAQQMRQRFDSLGDATVPTFVQTGAAIIFNIVLPAILLNVTAGWLFDEILAVAGARPAAARDLALLAAEGGEVSQTGRIVRRGGGRYLLSTIQYEVAVGSETRTSILYACIFPIKVVPTRFRTESPHNDKIVEPVAAAWGIFDLESQSWDETNFRPTHQSQEHMYFLQDEYENDQVAGQAVHRLALWGGGWERRHYDTPNFGLIYPAIVCE